ncbi:MAG TPA: MGMT family protein [Methanocorpusculum sp.]|nr:MGMT family protein [Methanocorpusculum sp.]
MANEKKKDFNKMLNEPMEVKIVTLEGEQAARWGGSTMVIAPKKEYDAIIKTIPKGKLVTTAELRSCLAKRYHTDITCPLTAGIFTNICAWASYQRSEDITPFWRVLKAKGELNLKFPEYPTLQTKLLEEEGFEIVQKRNRYFVKDFEDSIIQPE